MRVPYDVEITTKPIPSKNIHYEIETLNELKKLLEDNKDYIGFRIRQVPKKVKTK